MKRKGIRMDQKKWDNLTNIQKEQVEMLLSSLKEFSYGFERADLITDQCKPASATIRFYMNSLFQYCANYYLGDGGNKLKSILMELDCGDLFKPIEGLLSSHLGKTRFGEILKNFRDKMLTQPNFLIPTVEEQLFKKFDILKSSNGILFGGMINELFYQTQVLFLNISGRFPEISIED